MKNVMMLNMLWGFALLAACTPTVRSGIYDCDTDADCPKRQFCHPLKQRCTTQRPDASENEPQQEQAGAQSPEDAAGSGGTSGGMSGGMSGGTSGGTSGGMSGAAGSRASGEKAGEKAPPPSPVCGEKEADCNADAADGCETTIVNDAQNCGGCGKRCEPSDDAVATCDRGRCMQYAPSVGKASAGAAHGGQGGSAPLALVCPQGQVLVGAAFTVDTQSLILADLELRCAPLKLVQSSTGKTVVDHGNVAERPAMDVESPYERTVRDCAAQTIVTSIRGAVEKVTFDNESTAIVVTQLALGCSRLTFGPQERIVIEPGSVLQSATDPDNFEDECPKGQAVVGFTGVSGQLLDLVRTLCAPIVDYQNIDSFTDTNN